MSCRRSENEYTQVSDFIFLGTEIVVGNVHALTVISLKKAPFGPGPF